MAEATSAFDAEQYAPGLRLTFPDPNQESRFTQEAMSTWIQWDSRALLVCITVGMAKIAAWYNQNSNQSATNYIFRFAADTCIPLVLLFVIHWHPRCYNVNRDWIFFWTIVCSSMASLVAIGIGMWAPGLTILRVFSLTPLPVLLLSSMHRKPFKRYFWVHLVVTLASSIWLVNLYLATKENREVDLVVNKLGQATEAFIARMAVFGLPVKISPLEQDPFSCWLVGLFYHLWMGFFVPTMIVHVSEFMSRVAFLREFVDQKGKENLNITKVSRLLFLGLASIIGPQTIWVFLKGLSTGGIMCSRDELKMAFEATPDLREEE